MKTAPKEIELYVTSAGQVPYEDWFNALRDVRAQARIDARMARLRAGNPGDCKSVRQGVYELRVDYGPGYRVYFANVGARLVLLLIGGDKTTQAADVSAAKKYWADFQRRRKVHG